MEKKYRVIAIEINKPPYEKEMTFKEIQKFIDGFVETAPLYDNIVALVNEDGIRLDLPPNRHVLFLKNNPQPISILGNFVIAKLGKEDFESLNDEDIKKFHSYFS